jgi:predicted hydrocarbon binding protein
MLISRKEIDGYIIEALYESSNIVFSRYNKNTNDLDVVFKSGVEYTYKNVASSDYSMFEMAESQGKILNKRIKSYEAVKNGVVDVELLKEQILEVKTDEVNKMKLEVINSAEALKQLMDNGSSNINQMTLLKDMKNLIDLILSETPTENE